MLLRSRAETNDKQVTSVALKKKNLTIELSLNDNFFFFLRGFFCVEAAKD